MRMILMTAAMLFAGPAIAQPEVRGDDKIVVTGILPTDKQIKDFVDALVAAPAFGQLGRFEKAICPNTAGVMPRQSALIIERMRDVARGAGMKVAPPACAMNIMVIVTDDSRAMIEALEKKHPVFLTGITGDERKKLRESNEPAVAWHLKGPPMNADGVELQNFSKDGADGSQLRNFGPEKGYSDRSTRSPSRTEYSARLQYAAAVVVIEADALSGLSTTQIADYAAMRTFIRSDPDRLVASTAPSILTVLDSQIGDEVPVTLSSWDFGVLRGLYSSNPHIAAAAQRSEIRKELKDGLENPDSK